MSSRRESAGRFRFIVVAPVLSKQVLTFFPEQSGDVKTAAVCCYVAVLVLHCRGVLTAHHQECGTQKQPCPRFFP